jgi:hypothetical protein
MFTFNISIYISEVKSVCLWMFQLLDRDMDRDIILLYSTMECRVTVDAMADIAIKTLKTATALECQDDR